MKNNNKLKSFIIYLLLSLLILVTIYLVYYHIKNDNSTNKNNYYGDKKSYKAFFELNGASSIENLILTCEYKGNDCGVILPVANRKDGIILGYSINKNDQSATYKIGDTVTLNQNTTFYVISYSDYNLSIDNSNVDTINKTNLSCKVYNTESNCLVTLPFFNKIGYENRGYSNNKNSIVGFVFPNSQYKLYKDITLYPIANTFTRNRSINVNKVVNINNLIIEIENNCDSLIAEQLLGYVKTIKEKMPYLIVDSKVTFLNNKTFSEVWGENYVGMNYGPTYQRIIDIRCSNDFNNYYATIIHEAAHTWDFYYSLKFNKTITEENDILNLYNKYSSSSNKPFRDYSYTSVKEFFADMVRYYYLKYLDYDTIYSKLDYPSDIKKVLEKYMCIASNNYDETKCGG